MSKPRLLDLFARKGGSSMGYRRAGFDVTAVDIQDHSAGHPAGEFVQADALDYLAAHGHEFDVVHAGPPCQGQIAITKANRKRDGWTDRHVNLLPDTRAALIELGVPWVMENGPSEHIRPDLTICGLMFGLPTLRDRSFELGGWMAFQPEHPTHRGHLTIGWRHGHLRTVDGTPCPRCGEWHKGTVYGVYGKGGGKPSVAEAQAALGIDWMDDISDLNEAIPPAFTEYVGTQLLAQIERTAA